MVKNKKLILQVKGNKNNQKRVTIPKSAEDIQEDDYVEVCKLDVGEEA